MTTNTDTKRKSASEQILQEVTSWEGVGTETGRRGELSIRYGRKELGHLHGDRVLHIGFPRAVWRRLFEEGWVDYHPVFPGREGWAARRIENERDVRQVIEMIGLNYDRAKARGR